MKFTLERCIGYVTTNSIKIITDAFSHRLEKKGVTRIQWIALYYLYHNENISQKELAIKMNIKDSTVARLLDRMERDELITRVKSTLDRRITYIHLTEKGKEYEAELLPEGEIYSEKLLNGISDEEIEIFEKVLNTMVENISDELR